MIRSILLLAIVGLLSQPALAQLRDPGEVVTRHVSATEGQPLLVRNYAMWRSDCTPRGEPVVTITAQPQHGTVTMRPGLSTIREYTGGADNCVGHQVPGGGSLVSACTRLPRR